MTQMYWGVFWGVVVSFVVVEALLLYAAVRFRQPTHDETEISVQGSGRSEIIWTVVPALMTSAMLVFVWQSMSGY